MREIALKASQQQAQAAWSSPGRPGLRKTCRLIERAFFALENNSESPAA
jgi:hypothetical protein